MNDYYNYLNGFTDMNYMTNPNNMIGDLNYQSLMPNIQIGNKEINSILESSVDDDIKTRLNNILNNMRS